MAEMVDCQCSWCGGFFERLASQVRRTQGDDGKAGPFCKQQCASRYARSKQLELAGASR